MKGDVLVLQAWHRRVAGEIVAQILERVKGARTRYAMAVAGESGSGKSEMGLAISEELAIHGIKSVVLGQDDYFVLPPKSNDQERRRNPDWLGPHVEVRLDVLERNLASAINGQDTVTKPLINYGANTVGEETVDLAGIEVLIAEGTYTSLLKHVHLRIFIASNWMDTLADRTTRNRGSEVGDPFIEQVLRTEHKIIAGHRQLADLVITKDHELIVVS
jgi:uridine kinase